jgi:hypothetical protein
MPELDGVKVYQKVLNENLQYFDTANAEKVETINPLIVEKVGLHEAGIPVDAGQSKMSGGHETRSGGNLGEVCLDKAMLELGYMTFLGGKKELIVGGDNKAGAIDVDPSVEEVLSPSSRFLGWNKLGQTLHVTSDGVLHNQSLCPSFRMLQFYLKVLNEHDLMQSLLPTTVFGDDMPQRFLDAVSRDDIPIEAYEAGNFVNELQVEELSHVIELWNEVKEPILDQYSKYGIKFGSVTKFVPEMK